MQKTFIRENKDATLGYELVIRNDDGIETTIEITEKDPNNDGSLKLPENPSNRKYFSISRIKGETELTYKEKRTIEKSTEGKPRTSKKWADFMTDDEKLIVEEIMAKCIKRQKRQELLDKIQKYQDDLDNIEG